MKILAINGSYRGRQGHTSFLLSKLSKGAVFAGAEFDVVNLAELKINRCLSCGKCNSPEHHLQCVFDDKDDVRSVFEKMAWADILVFATPVYLFGLSSLMKTFLDRTYATADVFDIRLTQSGLFFHHIDPSISSKPFVVLVCCDNVEKEMTGNVTSYFRTYARFQDASQVGVLVRNAGRFAGHGKNPEAFRRAPNLARVYEAFETAGKELALLGHIKSSTEKSAAQNIIPTPAVFKILKHFRPFKKIMVQKARQMMKYEEGAV